MHQQRRQWRKRSRVLHLEPRTRHLSEEKFSAVVSLKGNVRGWEVHKTSCLLDVHLSNIILLLSAVKWNLTLCVLGWEIYLETTPLVRWQTVSPGRELIYCQPVSLCPALSSWSLCGSMPKIYWALQCPSPSTTPSVTLVRQQQWVFGEFVRCMATSAQRVCYVSCVMTLHSCL